MLRIKRVLNLVVIFLSLLIISCSSTGLKVIETKKETVKGGYNRQATDAYLRAMQYKEVGNLFGAVVEFQNAYKIQNDNHIQFEMAQCYYYLKQFDNSLKALDLALVDNPNDEEMLYWQLKNFQSLKKNSESIAVLNKLIQINPEKIDYYYFAMDVEFGSGNKDRVIEIAKSAVAICKSKDQKLDLYARIAELYLMQSNYDQAIAVQKQILDLAPDNLEQHRVLFLLQNSYGDKKEAELTLLNSVTKFKDDVLKRDLARFYAQEKDTLKAGVLYQSLLKGDSSDVYLYNEFAGMYDNIGNKERAAMIYQQAYTAFPENHSILNNYAYLLSEINQKLDFARTISKKSLEKDPESASYLDTYGWINYKLGNYQVAEEYILKAIDKDSAKTQVFILYEHLGDIKVKQSKNDEALELYRKAQELNPQPVLEEKIRGLEK